MSIETSSLGTAGFFGRSWWVLLLRGLFAVVLGVLVFTKPVWTLGVVMLAFSLYVLVEGASDLFAAMIGWRHRDDRWLLLLEGLVGIGVGVVTLRTPAITAMLLVFFMAVWALVTGPEDHRSRAAAARDPGRGMVDARGSGVRAFRTGSHDAATGRGCRTGRVIRRIRADPGYV